MKFKRATAAVFCVLVLVAVLTLALQPHKTSKVLLTSAGQTVDAVGQVHVYYELTNTTSEPFRLVVLSVETLHKRTGWWPLRVPQTAWHMENPAVVVRGNLEPTLTGLHGTKLDIT